MENDSCWKFPEKGPGEVGVSIWAKESERIIT